MNRECVVCVNDTRTHSSYFTSTIEISGFWRSYFTHCCVRCPPVRLTALRRTGRILLGFPAPWFDCPLLRQPRPRFCPRFRHGRLPCHARTSGRWLTSGARQPLSKINRDLSAHWAKHHPPNERLHELYHFPPNAVKSGKQPSGLLKSIYAPFIPPSNFIPLPQGAASPLAQRGR